MFTKVFASGLPRKHAEERGVSAAPTAERRGDGSSVTRGLSSPVHPPTNASAQSLRAGEWANKTGGPRFRSVGYERPGRRRDAARACRPRAMRLFSLASSILIPALRRRACGSTVATSRAPPRSARLRRLRAQRRRGVGRRAPPRASPDTFGGAPRSRCHVPSSYTARWARPWWIPAATSTSLRVLVEDVFLRVTP